MRITDRHIAEFERLFLDKKRLRKALSEIHALLDPKQREVDARIEAIIDAAREATANPLAKP